jgi:hypothetical protein
VFGYKEIDSKCEWRRISTHVQVLEREGGGKKEVDHKISIHLGRLLSLMVAM